MASTGAKFLNSLPNRSLAFTSDDRGGRATPPNRGIGAGQLSSTRRSPQRPRMDALRFLFLAKREAIPSALTVLGTCGLAAAYLAIAMPQYTANMSLYFDPNTKNVVLEDSTRETSGLDAIMVESQVEVIGSGTVLGRVVDELKLAEGAIPTGASPTDQTPPAADATIVLQAVPGAGSSGQVPNSRQKAVLELSESVRVKRVGKSYVVNLAVMSYDPVQAVVLVNAIFAAYVAEFGSGVNIRVISPPSVPRAPSRPIPALIMPVALLSGIAFALGRIFAKDLADDKAWLPADVEFGTGIAVLATIPEFEIPKSTKENAFLITTALERIPKLIADRTEGGHDSVRPAVFRLLNRLLSDHQSRHLITQVGVSEDGDELSVALAAAAALLGKRTLLIDTASGDEQAVTVGHSLPTASSADLSQFITVCPLTGFGRIAIKRNPSAPRCARNEAQTASVLAEILKRYDIVFIHAGLLRDDELDQPVHQLAQSAVIVANAGSSTLGSIVDCAQRLSLAQLKSIGVVLTRTS